MKQSTETAHTEREVWARNNRSFSEPGPWHLVKRRAERAVSWSLETECGVYPDRYAARADDRPTAGKFCRKCLRAAEVRHPPGKSDS